MALTCSQILGAFTPNVNISQRRSSCALYTEAGRALADPAAFTSQPRSTALLGAAPTAAPYRATPANGAAGFWGIS